MLEPYEQEERRQAEWDRLCSQPLRCECCGQALIRCEQFLEIEHHIYCGDCVESHMRFTDELEV